MGICDSKNNSIELSNTKEKFQPNQNEIKINESIKKSETNIKTNRMQECIIESSHPYEKVDWLVSIVSKSICKIKIETSIETIKGTGFLLAIWI